MYYAALQYEGNAVLANEAFKPSVELVVSKYYFEPIIVGSDELALPLSQQWLQCQAEICRVAAMGGVR